LESASDPRSQFWPDDGTLDWLWPVAERLHIPVSLQASAFLPRVGEIAERHPGLKISIDHMGVVQRHQELTPWRQWGAARDRGGGRRLPPPAATCRSCWH
jgi:hypothetical protein